MSKCKFSISFSGDATSIIAKAREAINQENGKFEGDTNTGAFSIKTPLGTVKGAYQMEIDSINIEISDKPMFLSCTKIEQELQKYLLS